MTEIRRIKRVAILHGAGYVGGELIQLLLRHPDCTLEYVTSRAFEGNPLWHAHPALRQQTDLLFSGDDLSDLPGVDAVFVAAEHGQGAATVNKLLSRDYDGVIVDLSADFRFKDATVYDTWFGFTHPAPHLLNSFQYGIPEIYAPYPSDTRFIANPGCFATALTLALWPVAKNMKEVDVSVTALTGASGSGAKPKETTHFPTREGNVRAYKVLNHQHLPEVIQTLGEHVHIAFVPVSGPWTRGIWGTAQIFLNDRMEADVVAAWFSTAYEEAPFVRLWPGVLPEMRYAVGTPFCDIGWILKDRNLIIGVAIDNLLKGAASQAIQNLNLLFGLPEYRGLIFENTSPVRVDF